MASLYAQYIWELLQLWDVEDHDGPYMPRAAACILRVPQVLDVQHSGEFTQSMVKGICERHVAAGVYPCIHYTNPKPSVISAVSTIPASGVVNITWPDQKPGSTFDVLTATADPFNNPDVVWIEQISNQPQAVSSGLNSGLVAIVSGVDNFIWVRANHIDGDSTSSAALGPIRYTKCTLEAIGGVWTALLSNPEDT